MDGLTQILLCVESFSLQLVTKENGPLFTSDQLLKTPLELEVVLLIEEMRLISFDRFNIHLKENIAFDE